MSKALPEFDLERYLPYRMTVVAGRLSAELARQYRTKYNISVPEWRVLLNVGYSDDLSIKDIERRVGLEKSKVSRAASKLEAKGYLTKQVDGNDRRLLKLAVTQEGAVLLQELIPLAEKFQTEVNAVLGEHRQSLDAALDRLMERNQ